MTGATVLPIMFFVSANTDPIAEFLKALVISPYNEFVLVALVALYRCEMTDGDASLTRFLTLEGTILCPSKLFVVKIPDRGVPLERFAFIESGTGVLILDLSELNVSLKILLTVPENASEIDDTPSPKMELPLDNNPVMDEMASVMGERTLEFDMIEVFSRIIDCFQVAWLPDRLL